MSGRRRDYRSYLLRLYRVREGEETSWRASLQSATGGKQSHFRSLSELVGFLEKEGELEEQGEDEGDAEEEPEAREKRCRLFRWLGLGMVALGCALVPLELILS